MARNLLTCAALLVVGLFVVATSANENAKHLDDFVQKFLAAEGEAKEVESLRKRFEVAELFATRLGASRGYPVELDQIKRRVQKDGLAFLEDYQFSKGALQNATDLAALVEAAKFSVAGAVNLDEMPDRLPEGTSLVIGACRVFINKLTYRVFGADTQFEALHRSGQLEEEVRREGARDDVAKFLFGWAQLSTCKLLTSMDASLRRELDSKAISLLIKGEAAYQAELEPAKYNTDQDALFELASAYRDAVNRLSPSDLRLVEYFTSRLIASRPGSDKFVLAIKNLTPDLGAFLAPAEKFGSKSDVKALLRSLESVKISRENRRFRLPAKLKLDTPQNLVKSTKSTVAKACSAYQDGLKHLAMHARRFDLLETIQQLKSVALPDPSTFDKIREFLKGWVRYLACEKLTSLPEEELELIFKQLSMRQSQAK